MRKLITCLFISIIAFSCQKEKTPVIVGGWREDGNYIKNSSGEFYWESASRFPLFLELKDNGEYSAFNDVPAGHGIYQYNYSTRQLRLENSVSGSIQIDHVSVLDENKMIVEIMHNNELMRKVSYHREHN